MATLNNEQLDDPLVFDGIADFSGGQASNRPANLLSVSQSLTLQNVDIKTKLAVTRRGTISLGAPTPSRIQGLQWFSTPSVAFTLAIAGGSLWKYNETIWASVSGYTAAGGSTVQVGMTQLIDTIYIADAATDLYSWDGTTMTDLGTGSNLPPQGNLILAHTNRLWCAGNPAVPDQLNASTALVGGWDTTYLSIRIGAGDGDPITGLAPWDSSQIVVLKRNSVYIVQADPVETAGGSGAPLSNATITKVSDIGCVGGRAWALVGTDIFFLSDTGVHSLRRVISSNSDAREVGPALSEPLADVIQEINWAAAGRCAGFFWDNKFLLSLPLNGAADPNSVLVYDTLQLGWSGIWVGWAALQFLITKASGLERLNFGQPDGSVWRWLDYIPLSSETAATFQDAGANIPTLVESRGFIFGDGAMNIGAQGIGFVDSQSPKSPFSVSAEFFQSQANASLSVELDQGDQLPVSTGFDTSGGSALLLPFLLPQTLSSNASFLRTFPMRQFNRFRCLQVVINTVAGKLSLRSLAAKAFADTIPPEQ